MTIGQGGHWRCTLPMDHIEKCEYKGPQSGNYIEIISLGVRSNCERTRNLVSDSEEQGGFRQVG